MRTMISGLLLLCSLGGHAAETLSINVDPSNPQFVVKLAANPTTGYHWTVTSYDKKILQLTNSHYVAPQTKLIGAGGEMTFTFTQVKGKTYPQSTLISFTYARPWDLKSTTLKQVTINFTKTTKNK